jgi:hypothetical protein
VSNTADSRTLDDLEGALEFGLKDRRSNELLRRPAKGRIKILHDPNVGLRFTQGDNDVPAVGAHAAR